MWKGEAGDGELFARLHQKKFLYVPQLKKQWLMFNGVTWEDTDVHQIERAVAKVAELYDLTVWVWCWMKRPLPVVMPLI